MERAVLFFDIDGTILSEYTRTVPESAVTALKAAQAAEPMRSSEGIFQGYGLRIHFKETGHPEGTGLCVRRQRQRPAYV